MPSRQISLLKRERTEHGGDVRCGLRKEARPFSPRCSIHVVMRSHNARGGLSMLHRRNRATIEKLVYKWAAANGVRVYRFANVGNHLHMLIKTESRTSFQRFLRTFAGLAARAVTGSQKGASQGKFWESTAYSSLVPPGAFKVICAYLAKNRLEAVGFGGARLKIRANGEIAVVVGDTRLWTDGRARIQPLIRGEPPG